MSMAIGLALLLLGTTGALAAFGGETWVKGDADSSTGNKAWKACLILHVDNPYIGGRKSQKQLSIVTGRCSRGRTQKFEKATVELKSSKN